MEREQMLNYSLEAINKAGAEKADCFLTKSEVHELNVENERISLLRTTYDTSLVLKALKENKKAIIKLNKTSKEDIDTAIEELMEMVEHAQADPANDISEKQEPANFETPLTKPDMELMHKRLTAYLVFIKEKYPCLTSDATNLKFMKIKQNYVNTNGVRLSETSGRYQFTCMFVSKKDGKSSSFNYSYYLSDNLEKNLWEYAGMERLFKQSDEQIETTGLQGKFVGDIIITPECVGSMFGSALSYLKDMSLISGKSIYKDKLGEKIASEHFTLHSQAVDENLAISSHITSDGYTSENITVIENGILKTFLLSRYGAAKLDMKRSANQGSLLVLEPGKKTLDEMIASVDKGLLLCRFSGGNPSDNGDFAGVAKNSYYIENGEIKYPVSETMISSNVARMLLDITEISRERLNSGVTFFPWVKVKSITISGK
ncbi:MAG: TldD/PmbA family protein [Candidatus Cloacimonetes bacterium]|nr:TldD/PmbA family protein [Candidatus Cloacimonadota bacterium]